MRKFLNFCGIFATVFVTTTIVLLASCSQDDDNYDSDMYTLAEMGTRGGGNGGDPGGGGPEIPNTHVPEEPLTQLWEFYFHPNTEFNLEGYPNTPIVFLNPELCNVEGTEADVFVTIYRTNDVPVAELVGYVSSDPMLLITGVEFRPDYLPGRYTLWATGYDADMVPCSAVIPDHVFN